MSNLFGVLVSPTQTFERLRGKGGWVLTFIVLTVLSVALIYAQWPILLKTVEEQLANSTQPIPEDVKEMSLNIGRISAFAGAAIGPALSMFFVGLLLMLVNLIVRGEATYMQLAKASLFASIPGYVGGIIMAVLVVMLQPESIYEVSLTAGAFLEEKKGFVFGVLMSVFDPFAIWSLVLLIIGCSVMMRRSVSSIALWVGLGWLIVKLIGAFSV